MHVVICEDNESESEYLAAAIKKWSDAKKINIDLLLCPSAESFLFKWPDMVVDLVFLDIEMEEMNGIELAKKIREIDKTMLLVFVTNFTSYVFKGYDVDALHFLPKKASSFNKLNEVLDKAYQIWDSRKKDAIIIKNASAQIKLYYQNIHFIEIHSSIVEVHTDSGIFEVRKTGVELMKSAPSHFVRCHRSCIVNIHQVDSVYSKELRLLSGKKLTMGRNYIKHVKDSFVSLNR